MQRSCAFLSHKNESMWSLVAKFERKLYVLCEWNKPSWVFCNFLLSILRLAKYINIYNFALNDCYVYFMKLQQPKKKSVIHMFVPTWQNSLWWNIKLLKRIFCIVAILFLRPVKMTQIFQTVPDWDSHGQQQIIKYYLIASLRRSSWKVFTMTVL